MMDGTPRGYAVITFDGVKYWIDYKVMGAPADYRMNVEVLHADDALGELLYVNYFLGSARTQVDFRVGNGDWRSMDKVAEIDPVNRRMDQAWKVADPGRRRNAPTPGIPSTHLWKASLPAGPRDSIEVRVTDVDGRMFFARTNYGGE
jgi:hypothetical protein